MPDLQSHVRLYALADEIFVAGCSVRSSFMWTVAEHLSFVVRHRRSTAIKGVADHVRRVGRPRHPVTLLRYLAVLCHKEPRSRSCRVSGHASLWSPSLRCVFVLGQHQLRPTWPEPEHVAFLAGSGRACHTTAACRAGSGALVLSAQCSCGAQRSLLLITLLAHTSTSSPRLTTTTTGFPPSQPPSLHTSSSCRRRPRLGHKLLTLFVPSLKIGAAFAGCSRWFAAGVVTRQPDPSTTRHGLSCGPRG